MTKGQASLVSLLCIALSGCSFGVAACTKHRWNSQVMESEIGVFYEHPIPGSYFQLVSGEALDSARVQLKNHQYIAISPADALAYTGSEKYLHSGFKFYLVRGIVYPKTNGSVAIYRKGSELLVHFGYLGNPGGMAAATPIVVMLNFKPTALYTLCTGTM